MRQKLLGFFALLVFLLIGYLRIYKSPINSVIGYILPHNPALLGDINKYIGEPKVDTVVILAPNHQDEGGHILTLSDDKAFVEQEYAWTIYKELFNSIDPRIEVIPYLFRRGLSVAELMNLADTLRDKYPSDKTIFIASVDFSHNTDEKTASEKDQITIGLIKNQNWNELIKLNSSYLDCPECIIVFCQVTERCNAMDKIKRLYLKETSYFFGRINLIN